MKQLQKLAILAPFSLFAFSTSAYAYTNWSSLIGYTVIHTGVITGFIDKDGRRGDDFEGCDYGRKLIIDDQYMVACSSYIYHYAYRPDVVVLSRGSN